MARALGAAVVAGGGAAAASNPYVRRSDAAAVSSGAAAAALAVGAAAVATANDAAAMNDADSDSDEDDSDVSNDGSDDDDDDEESSSSSDDSDEEEEEEAALAAAEAADADNGNAASAPASAPPASNSSNLLNAALLSAYAAAPKESTKTTAAAPLIPEGAAFAPREAVAAAAARALAAEAAATAAAAAPATQPKKPPPRQQQQQQQQQQPQLQQLRRGRGGSGQGGSAKKRSRLTAGGGFSARGGGGGGGAGAATAEGPALPSNHHHHHHQFLCEPRAISFDDLGGLDPVLASLRELVEYPLSHPEVFAWLGVDPPRGLLLHGPPGCGKTALAHAIARRANVPFLRVAAPEVVAGVSGESEAIIRGLFASAAALAPCVVFIDEIDAIAPRREAAQREMERRIVAQLLTCMDDLASQAQLAREGARRAAAGEGGAHDESGGGDDSASGAAAAADGNSRPRPPLPSSSPSTLAAVSDALRRHVVIIGATNRPDALDPALRRAGRFDREISLPVPTEAGRASILRVLTRKLRLSGACDVSELAARTPGYVGADLEALAKEAAASAVTKIFARLDGTGSGGGGGGGGEGENGGGNGAAAAAAAVAAAPSPMEGVVAEEEHQEVEAAAAAAAAAAARPPPAPAATAPPSSRLGAGPLTPLELASLAIEPSDFEAALSRVQPAVRREGFSSPPAVSWADVGALSDLRSELEYAITRPIADPGAYAALGLSAPTGVLLYGPPGCGKTLLARAVAAEARANFISVKGPELLSKYVGESEAAVRRMFARAASAAPCVLFFDELDALAPRRGRGGGEGAGGGGDSSGAAAERVVNQLLTEMDGLSSRGAVFLVGATNRPDIIDPALLRPGRLDKALYVPLPDSGGRGDIMRRLTRKTPLAEGSDPCALAASRACEGFSGADLASLVREAGVCAIREAVELADREGGGAASVVSVAGAGSTAATQPQQPQERPRLVVRDAHFRAALRSVGPSVSKRDVRVYDALRSRLAPKPLLVEEEEEEEEGDKEREREGGGGKSGDEE